MTATVGPWSSLPLADWTMADWTIADARLCAFGEAAYKAAR